MSKRGVAWLWAAIALGGCAQLRPSDRPQAAYDGARVDPKSTAAAAVVVQRYGALIARHRFAEARSLWGDAASAAAFESVLRQFIEAHVEVGEPGESEGAAGSIYVTVPAIFSGPGSHGSALRRSAKVILRRVNDVPGSTEAQRRWHIQRIEWTSGP